MSLFLRVIAGLVMLLGLLTLGVTLYAMLASYGSGGGVVLDTMGLQAVSFVLTLGGVLWAVTRIAYRSPTISSTPPEQSPTVLPGRYGMAWVLWIVALMQMGLGITGFVIGYVITYWPGIPVPPRRGHFEILSIVLIPWCYACLGGILLALTRMAYPPTPRPESPDGGGAPRGPASV